MSKRILLADDSLTIQKVVELTFMDEDFEVDAVGSGDEAISRLDGELPSILIADVHMPGASGYQVCRQAKEKSASLPVLLLVGTFEALDENEMVACGADGHLKKPFDSQELLQVVQRMTSGDLPAAQPPAIPAVEGFESTGHEASAEVADDSAAVGFDLGGDGLEGDPEIAPVDLGDLAPAQEEQPPTADQSSAHETVFIEAVPSTPEAAAAAGSEASVVEVDEDAAPDVAEASGAESAVAGIAADSSAGLSDSDVDRIARRVVEMLGDDTVREVAWDVIPDLAEIVIKDRIRELEAEVE